MRIVTLTDHPANIAVFAAKDMHDALNLADTAFAQDGIQGAVWAAPPIPLEWDSESSLSNAFRTAISAKSEGRYDVIVNAVMTRDNRREIGFGFYGQKHLPPGVLEPIRDQNLSTLSLAFGQVQLAIRHELAGTIEPHLDGANKTFQTAAGNRLFSGQSIRILCTRQGAGTIVYDPSEQNGFSANKGWTVGAGNYLFLTGLDGIREKALLHSRPEFVATKSNPRVVDVYDCTHH